MNPKQGDTGWSWRTTGTSSKSPHLSCSSCFWRTYASPPNASLRVSVVVDLEQLATAHEAVEVLMVSTTTHPKPFWRTVADDLDYVFELIRVADVGSDWKTLRDHRDPVAQEQSD
jgi:hypothetical protein